MKATFGVLGALVVALGAWKMIDDLVVFRRTVEARFAEPSRKTVAPPPSRMSEEARLPAKPLLGKTTRLPQPATFVDPMDYEPPPEATLLLPSEIDRGPARSQARIAADRFVADRRASWGIRDYHELRGEEYPGPMGTEVRYKVYQDGLEVVGLEVRVEVDANGNVTETANNYAPMGRADLSQPELPPDEAVRRSGIVQDNEIASAAMNARRVLFAASGADEPELSFSFSLDGDPSGPSAAIVRASDGQPLARNYARR
jgi:hypothetical protein